MPNAIVRTHVNPSTLWLALVAIAVTAAYPQPAIAETDETAQEGEAPATSSEAEEPERATGTHCYNEDRNVWVFREFLGLMSNSSGIENRMHAGACTPLIRRSGMLFDMTNMEAGIFNYLSPSYVHQGIYASIVPLSFLVLEAKASGVYVWSIGMAGAGHNPRMSYADNFRSTGFTHYIDTEPTTAIGFQLVWSATVRAAVTVAHLPHGGLDLIVIDGLGLEYWLMGDDAYYFNLRLETILGRSDLALTNDAAVLVSVPLTENISLMAGITDSLVYVPRADRVDHNMVGGIVAVNLKQLGRRGRVRGLQPFILVGGYTNHETRRLAFPVNFAGGVELSVLLD